MRILYLMFAALFSVLSSFVFMLTVKQKKHINGAIGPMRRIGLLYGLIRKGAAGRWTWWLGRL